MNAYERRKKARLDRAAERRSLNQEHKALEVDKILLEYENVFKALYGRPIKISFSKGWVSIRNKKVRLTRLQEMTRQLQARLHEQEISNAGN